MVVWVFAVSDYGFHRPSLPPDRRMMDHHVIPRLDKDLRHSLHPSARNIYTYLLKLLVPDVNTSTLLVQPLTNHSLIKLTEHKSINQLENLIPPDPRLTLKSNIVLRAEVSSSVASGSVADRVLWMVQIPRRWERQGPQ